MDTVILLTYLGSASLIQIKRRCCCKNSKHILSNREMGGYMNPPTSICYSQGPMTGAKRVGHQESGNTPATS